VIATPDEGLDTTQRIEVPLGAGMIRLLVICVAVGLLIDYHCEADRKEVMN